MVSINYATREVSCKIVFYGPGLSGKTTNLQYVHAKVPPDTKGKLISLATDADRTLYFDFLPINIGSINGFAAKFQLYTVPGQVYYNATRKLVLRGTDGLVFVADSQPDKMDENIESLNNLKENMAEYGYDINEVPIVIQYNKQDLPGVSTVEEMRPILNPHNWPEFRASATEGFGVFDTLKCILKLVLEKAKTGGTPQSANRQQVAPPPPPPPPAMPPTTTTQPQPEQVAPPDQVIPPQPEQQPVPPPIQPPQPVMSQGPLPAEEPQQHQPTTYNQPAVPPTPAQATVPPAPIVEPQPVITRQEVRTQAVTDYRPFPGNTVEQEVNMKSDQGFGGTAVADQASAPGSTETSNINQTSDLPAMAPPLKADNPRKKRSFFKRLFGLK